MKKKQVEKYHYYDYTIRKPIEIIENLSDLKSIENFNKKIAIQIHLYFVDIVDEIISFLNNIPFSFDCFISTSSEEKRELIQNAFDTHCISNRNIVEVFENKGRDVLPFLTQMKNHIDSYDYLCHIHSKKSETIEWGDEWRYHLFNNLLGSKEYIYELFNRFENDEKLGMVFPEVYPMIQLAARWNGTKECVNDILKDMNISYDLPREPIFSAGTMFWAKCSAIKPIFELDWDTYDFPDESGQIDFTPAHAIERIWVYLLLARNYSYQIVHNMVNSESSCDKNKVLIYACLKEHLHDFDISFDIDSMMKLRPYFKTIYFISDFALSNTVVEQLKQLNIHMKDDEKDHVTSNLWTCILKDDLKDEWQTIDELVLMDNQCFGPISSISNMFNKMKVVDTDWWTLYALPNEDKVVPISNFISLSRKVINDGSFKSFIMHETKFVSDEQFMESLYSQLNKAKLKYRPFAIESVYLNEMIQVENCTTDLPYDFSILNVPFIMKKAIRCISDDAREPYIMLLNQLELGKTYANKFVVKKKNIVFRGVQKIASKF